MKVDRSIPPEARTIVRQRSYGKCERCGGIGGQCHHRRTRSVQDQHVHCPCNLVVLCAGCHRWAHGNPKVARQQGWIVSKYNDLPGTESVVTPWGGRYHHCDGTITYI